VTRVLAWAFRSLGYPARVLCNESGVAFRASAGVGATVRHEEETSLALPCWAVGPEQTVLVLSDEKRGDLVEGPAFGVEVVHHLDGELFAGWNGLGGIWVRCHDGMAWCFGETVRPFQPGSVFRVR
jgi:hypothetical protein